ncbi:hypothetical protein ACF0H5_020593 [Mactra antiquata]
MENPMFQTPLPYRPIPVYGHRGQLDATRMGAAPEQAAHSVKCHTDHLILAKQINLISQMSRLRTLGEYHLNRAVHLGNIENSQIIHDVNKFRVRNLTRISDIGHSQTIAHLGHQTFEQSKVVNEERKTQTDIGLRSHGNQTHPTPAVVDRMPSHVPDHVTVPVIVSCANPYPPQYGYGRKVFPCPQCRYTTDRRNNLKRHMLTMHQTCSKTLECCGIVFATKASLREHAMIFHYHGYTCFYCGRRFCRKALLKRHLSVHNGQKDFVCPLCDYATSHKSNLERHRKVHCRPDGEKACDSNLGDEEMTLNWRSERSTDDNNNHANNLSSSEDENEEINVDSD